MPAKVSWRQVLAWRMQRHLLDPIGNPSVVEVVDRLCGVQTQVASSAELAIRLRRTKSSPGEVDRALSQGRLIKTWAMRGALHLLTPASAGVFLSLMTAGRAWERPSWQRHFGVNPDQIQALRHAVRAALNGEALTREELVEAVMAVRELAHAGEALRSGWGTLLKPLAWQGDLCFGPRRGNRVTFTLPEAASPRWRGILPPEEAGPIAIAAYLRVHGPSHPDAFGHWLAGGWFGKSALRGWFADLGDRLTKVGVDGETSLLLAEDVDALMSARPTKTLRMLAGFDQYVLGPGTGDGHVVPANRRATVSRQSGWISPVLVLGGVVSGIWEVDDRQVRLSWFSDAGKPPRRALEEEVARLASVLGRTLQSTVDLV